MGAMADSETLAELRAELAEVRATITKVQRGTFETRRGERYFAVPSLVELREQERVLIRAIRRCGGRGDTFQGVPSERTRPW